jgi:hypothetical protein
MARRERSPRGTARVAALALAELDSSLMPKVVVFQAIHQAGSVTGGGRLLGLGKAIASTPPGDRPRRPGGVSCAGRAAGARGAAGPDGEALACPQPDATPANHGERPR